jgi:hypothetical protein
MKIKLIFAQKMIMFIFLALVASALIVDSAAAAGTISAGLLLITFTDLTFTDGEDNMSGTQLIAYYIPWDDVLTIPAYAAVPASMADYGKLTGNITTKPGKYFKKLYATPDTGKVDDNKIDAKDSNGFKSIYEFFFPKNDASSIGFQRIASTGKFCIVVIDNDGNKRLFGSKAGNPAYIESIAATSDTTSGGNKGATFQFVSYQSGPAPILVGTFPTESDSSSSS